MSSNEEPNGPAVQFMVRGMPIGQGSMRAVVAGGRGHVVHNAPKGLYDWRLRIGQAAGAVMGAEPLIVGPVRVDAYFSLQRPKSHFGADGIRLRPSAPLWAPTTPDIDKLARALLDALTGVCFGDDRQVVSLLVMKQYSDDDYPPGVSVTVAHVQRQLA